MMRSLAFATALLFAATTPAYAKTKLYTADVLASGVTPPEPRLLSSEMERFRKPGTAAVRGRIVAKLPGSQTIVFFNRSVLIIVPVISYTTWFIREMMFQWRNPKYKLPTINPDFVSLERRISTDDDGYFEVTGLAAGDYMIYTFVAQNEHRIGNRTDSVFVPDLEMPHYEDRTSSYTYGCVEQGFLGGAVHVDAGKMTDAAFALLGSASNC